MQMDNILFQYLEERFKQSQEEADKLPGPVITISRETGCSAILIAQELVRKINEKYNAGWTWIDKEILKSSATELDNNLKEVMRFFDGQERSQLEEILSSFYSKHFHSDMEIKNTVRRVISSVAQKGNAVIIGRGGVAIAKNISKSLHVRIFAPYEWRVENCMRKFKMSEKEAKKFVNHTDIKRQKLIELLYGCKIPNIDAIFDVSYNRSKLLAEEISDSIFELAVKLKLFEED